MRKHSQRHAKYRTIRAAAKCEHPIHAEAVGVEWINAAEGESGPKKFSMTAYTGGPMMVGYYGSPVIIDLTGLTAAAPFPILMHHDPRSIVGHADAIDVGPATIKLSGLISGASPEAAQVQASAAAGFPWKASVGARPDKMEYVGDGVETKVNGKTYKGPLYVARKSTLGEVSFVPIAADGKTAVKVAAAAAQPQKGSDMNFENWVQALGLDFAALTDQQKEKLRAKYNAEVKANEAQIPADVKAAGVKAGASAPTFDLSAVVLTYEKHVAAVQAAAGKYAGKIEAAKLAEIQATAATKAAELKAEALNGEKPAAWLEVQLVKAQAAAEVELIRAERPAAPAIHGSQRDMSPQTIEAALSIAAGSTTVEKDYKPEVLEAADKLKKDHGSIGLHTILLLAAHANGYLGSAFGINRGNVREVIKAAFSTQTLSGILSNIANKFILQGFFGVEQVWRSLAAIRNVNDFKTITSYRMLDDLVYEEVGPAGKIKHGKLDEESYTNRAKTYAKMFTLTRQDIINDDLGAFDSLRSRLGRGHGIKLNQVFWAAFLDDAAFFTAPRGNLIVNVLGEAGIAAAVLALNSQTDGSGNPIDILGPHMLLTGPTLEPTAKKWYSSQEMRDTTANAKFATANIYQNTYKPIMSRYITSTTAWYLVPEMAGEMAPMEVAFLDGQESPIVESAEAEMDELGVAFRGYGDFGCAKKEFRASVKSTGGG